MGICNDLLEQVGLTGSLLALSKARLETSLVHVEPVLQVGCWPVGQVWLCCSAAQPGRGGRLTGSSMLFRLQTAVHVDKAYVQGTPCCGLSQGRALSRQEAADIFGAASILGRRQLPGTAALGFAGVTLPAYGLLAAVGMSLSVLGPWPFSRRPPPELRRFPCLVTNNRWQGPHKAIAACNRRLSSVFGRFLRLLTWRPSPRPRPATPRRCTWCCSRSWSATIRCWPPCAAAAASCRRASRVSWSCQPTWTTLPMPCLPTRWVFAQGSAPQPFCSRTQCCGACAGAVLLDTTARPLAATILLCTRAGHLSMCQELCKDVAMTLSTSMPPAASLLMHAHMYVGADPCGLAEGLSKPEAPGGLGARPDGSPGPAEHVGQWGLPCRLLAVGLHLPHRLPHSCAAGKPAISNAPHAGCPACHC